MHLHQVDTHLVSCLFEPGIYFTRRGGVQLGKTRVETWLLGKEVISPYVSLENRVEGCGIITRNLHIHHINMLEENIREMYRTSCSMKRMVMREGIGTSRMAICRRRVDFPTPLRPMIP